ncbi:oxysterol-binding protein-related protein 11-like, partial [Liolophura sinensis]|uniref:oxysterol-binding protein-related protein 11-like n=1 Tax=Liolophura sinensis TaxID=3198878 RepID=UPI0031587EE5
WPSTVRTLIFPDLSGLTDGERQQVIAVMQRAKEFEVQEERTMRCTQCRRLQTDGSRSRVIPQHFRKPLEGQLYKYTNVMKGWQYRWFVLDPESGMLEYFEKEEHKKQRARASVHLAGAVICPSDEDSQTFTVNAANSEIYRLRAVDAKQRQHWVDRLRATAQHHTATMAQGALPVNRENWGVAAPVTGDSLARKKHTSSQDNLHMSGATHVQRSHHKPPAAHVGVVSPDLFTDSREHIHEAEDYASSLSEKIEELPSSSPILNPLDKDLLLMKATSVVTLQCLSQCLSILQKRRTAFESGVNLTNTRPQGPAEVHPVVESAVAPAEAVVSDPASLVRSLSSASSITYPVADPNPPEQLNHDEEVEDSEEYKDSDLEGVEEHKSIILHLLSQLKLGMDLTKVVLPTFILERRSLLELFADCMAHPDIFLRIPDLPSAESRMLAVLQWYLTSFHAGRQGSVAKKPYNPIIGETFHCSWRLSPKEIQDCEPVQEITQATTGKPEPVSKPDDKLHGMGDKAPSREKAADRHKQTETETSRVSASSSSGPVQLTYCAEQVSHHPPISAFYFECPEKQMCMNASIYTKSKFMGMSIGLVMVGKISLRLLEHDEEYVFGLPSVYARSILTVPWVELGDKIHISCQKTNLSAAVTFHTKPFYGGKLHRVSAEVKDNLSGTITCRVQGEWNKSFEFCYTDEESQVIDVVDLKVYKKRVRPLDKQGEYESRRLWQHVTNALAVGDVNTATEHKKFLEARQREGERHRRETNTEFPTKFFHKEGDTWVYNNMLKPRQTKGTL